MTSAIKVPLQIYFVECAFELAARFLVEDFPALAALLFFAAGAALELCAGALLAVDAPLFLAVPVAVAPFAGAASRSLAPLCEAPWRRVRDAVCGSVEGSATCSRCPGCTLMPVILFQRRN